MGQYKCKGIRGNWVEDDMKFAMSAVKRGVMRVNIAAKRFNVPRRTLRRYLAENKNTKSTLGKKPLLNSDQENDLKSRIIRLCSVGYPLTQRVLRSCVKTFCNEHNILSKSQGVMIRRDWLRGFLRRHPNISKRKAQNLNPARAQKLNKAVVSDYFAKLKDLMKKYDLMKKPERIYNIDEKGCQLNLHKTPQVLAERGTKRVHIVAAEHGESVTVVSCGNVLLIFDGTKCHLDYSIVETAEKYEIKLFCLPSNTTHELQPMDKSVFRSFEYYWDEEILRYWSLHEDRKITKQRFGVIFSKVWDKAATPANIKAGFEATGIYPFNPDRIPEEAYAPSIPTYNPMPIVDNKDTDTDVSESLLHEAASNISAINTPVQQLTLSDNNFNSLSVSTEQIGNSATTPSQNITVCNEPK
ncbi:unnamed protein product [Parnassius apollo]|uniref:(apollo) hypothetical protein n=1 Tax=Parnassius apollo TaxID=110799 RepID=A0A8S3WTE6_PARAO|nr:unnamed protein product [Parnassius apollo]